MLSAEDEAEAVVENYLHKRIGLSANTLNRINGGAQIDESLKEEFVENFNGWIDMWCVGQPNVDPTNFYAYTLEDGTIVWALGAKPL